ncbi:MAG: hypothetical protein IJ684_02830 [Bacteroidales bacterium]|nr:hypothetical protein [Bacteroidales bacterium]
MEDKNKRKSDEIKMRLLEYAEKQHIPKYKFYEKISVPQSNFGGKSMESSLSSAKITEILITIPDLNPDWLLLGKGEMLRGESSSITDNTTLTTLLQRIEDLARENGQLQAENEELKKELARADARMAASARTA